MKTLHLKKTAALCNRLFKLERQGRYKEALDEIEDIWQDKTAMPDVKDLEPKLAAEFMLRCGSLIGFLGHNKQIPESQEISKNLLSEARSRFLKMYDFEKVAECENYIALAYQRTGEVNEAEVWIEQAIASDLPVSSFTKLHSYIIKSLILLLSQRYSEIIKMLSAIENDVLKSDDDCLKGTFYNQLGLAWEMSGKISEALKYIELSKNYHENAKHKVYLGTIHNDLALLYKIAKNFDKAYEMADISTQIFKKNKDRTREGFSLDTKAQIFLAEGKYDEALETIENALKILRLSENAAYLVETYLTKVKTLLYLEKVSEAIFCLFEAVEIARTKISEEAAKNLVAEFEKVLQIKQAKKISEVIDETVALYETQNSPAIENPPTKTASAKPESDENLELLLPKELAHYKVDDLRGVWINTDNLERYGLVSGSFALVAKDEVGRGELAAIEVITTGDVLCGKYDTDFGVVCLESRDGDLQLFDTDKVKVFGKIIGFGREKAADGKLVINPIKLI